MAVTTEPPWLNQSSGAAARNGSTSHTISFGFTSASGSLLVFVVFGAVTHTVGGGWTEQLQPVNSGELSVFTKTSAGESSITVTHNGSNYPNTWIAYEFPAGSSYTAGVGDTTSSDTFPALTGLPGTEQVVIAALGRTAASLSETAASATWSGSWVEDADLFTAFASTDGAALFGAHQINVTATSITPATTPTYTGSWGTPDREKVVFALDVAASGSTVNGTATIAGAGSVSAAVVQQAGAAVTGAGSVAANTSGATSGTATVTGVGSVSALARQGSTASRAGVGSVSATGIVIVPGSASVTGAGSVSALVRQGATAAVVGAGQVSASSAGQVITGTATVLGAGFVTAVSGSRITPRPNSGTTARPDTGTTARP